jgi:hypothetical protein
MAESLELSRSLNEQMLSSSTESGGVYGAIKVSKDFLLEFLEIYGNLKTPLVVPQAAV